MDLSNQNDSQLLSSLSANFQQVSDGNYKDVQNAFYKEIEPLVLNYYPYYQPYWVEQRSKIEQAFKVVQILIAAKLITIDKVDVFIKTVTKIAEAL